MHTAQLPPCYKSAKIAAEGPDISDLYPSLLCDDGCSCEHANFIIILQDEIFSQWHNVAFKLLVSFFAINIMRLVRNVFLNKLPVPTIGLFQRLPVGIMTGLHMNHNSYHHPSTRYTYCIVTCILYIDKVMCVWHYCTIHLSKYFTVTCINIYIIQSDLLH